MTYRTIVHKTAPTAEEEALILSRIPGELRPFSGHCRVLHESPADPEALADLRQRLVFDINPLPPGFEPGWVRLLVCDMDSTLIAIECIDELADMLNLKAQVAAITEAAMRGELAFAEALQMRVALLAGLPVGDLARVYEERLRFNPGAEILIGAAQRRGIRTAVVSGGFSFFTERVKRDLGLDDALSNELEIEAGRLTGRLLGSIGGAEAKAGFLARLRDELGIESSQCIAVGDGANDLPMLSMAGLGVAYHAKPVVQSAADAVINHGGLDAVCHFFAG